MECGSYRLSSTGLSRNRATRLLAAIVGTLIVFALNGCATNYQAASTFGYGFKETKLGPDRYRVTFKGNDMTDVDRATDFALLRCADLAIANGFSHVDVLTTDDRSRDGIAWTGVGLMSYRQPVIVKDCRLLGEATDSSMEATALRVEIRQKHEITK